MHKYISILYYMNDYNLLKIIITPFDELHFNERRSSSYNDYVCNVHHQSW